MEYGFFALLAFCVLREILMFRERREWAAERRLLMVRIQTPEAANRMDNDLAIADMTPTPSLPYDDDVAFHRHRQELN